MNLIYLVKVFFYYFLIDLRLKGINRTGNLLVPNQDYCLFEDWINPILDQMWKEQMENGTIWSPSKLINRLGKEINNPESVYYWCYKVFFLNINYRMIFLFIVLLLQMVVLVICYSFNHIEKKD